MREESSGGVFRGISVQWNLHLRFLLGAMDLNIKMGKILIAGNLTGRLLT
jgi:hypothetical protein